MYCSTCGANINQDLSYCSRCGARTSGAEGRAAGKLSEASFNTLIAGAIGIPIAGVGVLIGLISVMKKTLDLNSELIAAFAAAGFLLLLIAEITFIRLLIANARAEKTTNKQARLKDAASPSLDAAKTRELAEPPVSVTENTTRSFEFVRRESKTD